MRKVAQYLGWPLVTLDPSDFASGGLPLIATVASDVFTKLLELEEAFLCSARVRPPRRRTEQPGRTRPRRFLKALAVGAADTAILVLVVVVASWAITTFGPGIVSRPGTPAQVILPDLWPILRLILPLYFVIKTLRALLRDQ